MTKTKKIAETIIEDTTEEVGTVTFKRWQVALAAVAVTIALLVTIL